MALPGGLGNYAPPAGSGIRVSPELERLYLNTTPEAGFWAYLTGQGLLGQDPQSRFAQSRFSNYYGRFLAEAASDPNMGFFDYLNRQSPDPFKEFSSMAPEQRGDFTSRTLTPRARWAFR